MKLPANPFARAIAAGEKQVGLWISLCSNFAAEVVSTARYDWALIDMEHSANDYFSVLGQLQAVAATRYPPHGIRGVPGATRATAFGPITDYVARIEDETVVLLQLETRAAVKQAEAIGAVDGVSGIFFGPADIAADIGKIGKPMDPEVWALIKPAAQKLIAAMTKVQSQISSGACSIAQAALNGPQDAVRAFCRAFEARRDLVVARVAGFPGLTLDAPGGAYDLSPFFRISTAASKEVLNDAMDRIARAVSDLKGHNP